MIFPILRKLLGIWASGRLGIGVIHAMTRILQFVGSSKPCRGGARTHRPAISDNVPHVNDRIARKAGSPRVQWPHGPDAPMPCGPAALRRFRAAGFTLAELLMVMVVIAILLTISLSAMRTVARHTYKSVALAETKAIESAWLNYYAHYGSWPVTNINDDVSMPIDKDLSLILQGRESGSSRSNPDNVAFMEFAHLDKDEIPCSVWSESGRFRKEACRYYVMFDTNFDNVIRFPSNNAPWNAVMGEANYEIHRGVIVWTFNPELSADNENYLIGNWEQ